MAEPRKDLGEDDASLVDAVSDAAEKAADAISHKVHPMVERYATLFKTGLRTPVLRRPSDYGMDTRTSPSRPWTACPSRRGSSRRTRTGC